MKRLTVFAVLSVATLSAQTQTTISVDQLRPGTVVSAIVCLPPGTTGEGCKQVMLDQSFILDKSVMPYVLRVVSSSKTVYVGGPTGAIVVDNVLGQIDIATSTVPRKGQSEIISGLWAFSPGVTLPPVALPACGVPNKGRLLQDAADGALKFCNGTSWLSVAVPPEATHNHWSLRTSTAVLTALQSTFSILDSTIVPDSLKVHRNGILQTLGPDYTRGGLGVAAPVVFTAASMPQVGDTVTLEYMW